MSKPLSINCRGTLMTFDRPRIMGILNLTPDSFFDGGRFNQLDAALRQVEGMLKAGADIIDIGGYSSRPFATDISIEEELSRISNTCEEILTQFPEAIVSVDTFRSKVAKEMLEMGVHIINDISGGDLDEHMFETVASFGDVPYILMHMQGTPQNMQLNPTYQDIVSQLWDFFVQKINQAGESGIKDIVLDPGFGFGKSMLHNYQLLYKLDQFLPLEKPILVGVSRKSMLYKLLNVKAEEVLEMTTVLHQKAWEMGAHIIRVHDIKEAHQTVTLFSYLKEHGII